MPGSENKTTLWGTADGRWAYVVVVATWWAGDRMGYVLSCRSCCCICRMFFVVLLFVSRRISGTLSVWMAPLPTNRIEMTRVDVRSIRRQMCRIRR